MSLTSCLKKLEKTVSAEDAVRVQSIYGELTEAVMSANEAAIEAVNRVLAEAKTERLEIVAKIEKAGGVVKPEADLLGETEADEGKIEDFGEVIEGARKHLASELSSKLSDTEINVVVEPLSKSFPRPNYVKLAEEGVPGKTLAYVALFRSEIPHKPRQPYKVKRWGEQVETMRKFASDMLSGDAELMERVEKGLSESSFEHSFAWTAEAIKGIPADKIERAADIRVKSGEYSVFAGVRYDPAKLLYFVEKRRGMPYQSGGYRIDRAEAHSETLEGAIKKGTEIAQQMVEHEGGTQSKERSKYTDVRLYRDVATKKFYIAFKVRSTIIRVKDGFESSKAAREYRNENRDEIQQIIDDLRRGPRERLETNEPRAGLDRREGDITPEIFSESFGFRGVQFGNYVEGPRRQADLNRAYDALFDLADAVGVPPRALSLNGSLGLAFGARGRGGKNAAAAHFEPGEIAINLTKGAGPGSLAHEWMHGVDNYFARQDKAGGFMSERHRAPGAKGPVRDEVYKAWRGIEKVVGEGSFSERSLEQDKARSKPYFSTTIEKVARSFERYVIDKLNEKKIRNDYLANIDLSGGAYPTNKEMDDGIRAAYDKLFKALKTEETAEGNVRLYSASVASPAQNFYSGLLKAVEEAKLTEGTSEQWLGYFYTAAHKKTKALRDEKNRPTGKTKEIDIPATSPIPGVTLEEMEWIGLLDWLKQQKGPLTRDAVADFVYANLVDVQEVVKGEPSKLGRIEALPNGKFIVWEAGGVKRVFDTRQDAEYELKRFREGYPDSESRTKFPSYQTPGGKNYRELLLTLPTNRADVYHFIREHPEGFEVVRATDGVEEVRQQFLKRANAEKYVERANTHNMGGQFREPTYTGGHFGNTPNVIAHIRFNERVVDGKKILFIEEIQSDWHQKGRKTGYKTSDRLIDGHDYNWWNRQSQNILNQGSEYRIAHSEEYTQALRNRDLLAGNPDEVPNAPFKTTWPTLAMKRMIKYAADNGFDQIAWTTGDMQNARYPDELRKVVTSLSWRPEVRRPSSVEGQIVRIVTTIQKDLDAAPMRFAVEPNGVISAAMPERAKGKHIEELVGKEMADQIMAEPSGVIDAEDFVIGGEGMRGFYDKILRSAANKIGKKFGAKTGTVGLPGEYEIYQDVKSGLWFIDEADVDAAEGMNSGITTYETEIDAREALKKYQGPNVEVWSLPITDELREAVSSGGLPMFQSRRLTPAAQAAKPLIEEKVIEIIRRMTDGLEIQLHPDWIEAGNYVALEGSGGGTVAGGFADKIQGIIGIAMSSEASPTEAAFHEGWHFNEDFMTPREKVLMKLELPRLRRIVLNHYPSLGDRPIGEVIGQISDNEIIAYAGAYHMQRGLVGVHIGIRRFFDRMARMFRQIRNAMRGLGFNTAEDIFDIAETGKMKTRATPAKRRQLARDMYRATGTTEPQYSARRRPKTDPKASFEAAEDVSWVMRRLLRGNKSILGMTYPEFITDKGIMRQKTQDRMNSVKRQQRAIEASGGVIPESLDTYLAEENYYGKAGERQTAFLQNHIDPLTADMRERNITGVELGDYLYARHAPERNKTMLERNPDIEDGSGMSNDEAARIMARIAREGRTGDFEAVAKRIDRIIKDTRKRYKRAGLISKEEYEQWEDRWEFYVPLQGWADEAIGNEETEIGFKGRSGFDIRGLESQMAMGRTSRAENPMLNVIIAAERSILRAEKNEVAQTFLKMVRTYPNKTLWRIYTGKPEKRLNKDTGLIETFWVPPWEKTPDNVVSAKVNGEVKWIQIYHPGVYRGMKMLGTDNFNDVIATFGMLNRYLSRVNTSLNPGFIVRNFARDLQTAMIHLGEQDIRFIRLKVLRDVPAAIRGVFGGLKGKRDTKWQKHFEEFAVKAGGKVSYFDMDSLENKTRKIKMALEEGNFYRAFKWTWDLVDQINGAVENGVRLAAYVNLVKPVSEGGGGQTMAKAASFGRNMTVNFNRKGEWGPTGNALYLFYNVGINGPARMFQFMRREPAKAAKYFTAFMAFNYALDMLNYLISPEDEDGQKAYDKIEEWKRERNLIIMLPGREIISGIPMDGRDYLSIPLTWGYNVFFLMGREMAALTRNKMGWGAERVTISKSAANLTSSIVNAYLPVQIGGGLWRSIAPTIAKPTLEIKDNTNWHGGPIYRKVFPGQEAEPDSQLYFEKSVNPALRDLTKALNKWSGGNENRKGLMDINPEVIDHWMKFITGGAGKFWFDYIGGNALRIMEGEIVPPHKIPLLRSLRGRVDDYTGSNIFYDQLMRVRALDQEINAFDGSRDKEAVREARERDPHLTKMIDPYKAAAKDLLKLKKDERGIKGSRRMSEERKKQRLENVSKERNKVMSRARRKWIETHRELRATGESDSGL